MIKKYKIVIGYIRADIDIRKVILFLKKRFSKIKQLEVHTKGVGFQGSVRYLLASLDSKKDANKMVRGLSEIKWRGHSLMARVFQERTSANERRSVDWRSKKWGGPERRMEDRRSYKRRITDNETNYSLFHANAHLDPMNISYSSEEAKQFLSKLIGNKSLLKRSNAKTSNKTVHDTSLVY